MWKNIFYNIHLHTNTDKNTLLIGKKNNYKQLQMKLSENMVNAIDKYRKYGDVSAIADKYKIARPNEAISKVKIPLIYSGRYLNKFSNTEV